MSRLPSHTVFCSIGVYFLTSVCFAEMLQGQVKERPKHADILEFAQICGLFDLELESFRVTTSDLLTPSSREDNST